MKTITPGLFLEQAALGAEVQPCESAFQVGIQVGRFQYLCELEDFNTAEQLQLEAIYRQGQIRFGFPGDFRVAPYFFRKPLKTRRLTP